MNKKIQKPFLYRIVIANSVQLTHSGKKKVELMQWPKHSLYSDPNQLFYFFIPFDITTLLCGLIFEFRFVWNEILDFQYLYTTVLGIGYGLYL